MNIVANNIRRIMSENGLKQSPLAAKAGFSDSQFSAMLCGRKLILADYIPRIARALNVEVNELFATEDTDKPA